MVHSLSAALVLEDGSRFEGVHFGSLRQATGETVFTTGMVGYPQFLTDPSFRGQIVVCSYPLVGNYGVPYKKTDRYGLPDGFESERMQVSGFIVSDLCESPSHFASSRTLAEWCLAENVPGIAGIDTRSLTKHLRSSGTMRGKILVEGCPESSATLDRAVDENLAASVSCASPILYRRIGDEYFATPETVGKDAPQRWKRAASGRAERNSSLPGNRRPRILLIDCGVKANIIRNLLSKGADVMRVPWDQDPDGVDFDGVLLGNGPGDPKSCVKTIASVRKAMDRETPIFGICLGNQILALAAGADTYKLPYGHRSQNQPCRETGTDRCYITSQNHGYAVNGDSLPGGWQPWFLNANDGTIEGIQSRDGMYSAVQFHPEGCPGPRDTEFLFDRFLSLATKTGTKES